MYFFLFRHNEENIFVDKEKHLELKISMSLYYQKIVTIRAVNLHYGVLTDCLQTSEKLYGNSDHETKIKILLGLGCFQLLDSEDEAAAKCHENVLKMSRRLYSESENEYSLIALPHLAQIYRCKCQFNEAIAKAHELLKIGTKIKNNYAIFDAL
jgi:hypothetical protein